MQIYKKNKSTDQIFSWLILNSSCCNVNIVCICICVSVIYLSCMRCVVFFFYMQLLYTIVMYGLFENKDSQSQTKRCPNYLPVKHMKVNYFLICVYLKCFCKLAIRKLFMYCVGGGLQKYFLYAPMSIHCVEYASTVIYLLLVARNL